ncbi:filamentous hemagglutinin N-terminal domain-containing protein [Candidatus Albibeggiatoa sp. nov. NOAA]|uniref:two-partner secretion domain-containing protein n=1 Tax=Candidatus Albibeggiatoa sp. nov. NOAA TaxID=3162724 RepID=UPI0032F20ACF|nr:filamentous hemagglutinin N-terminal domain-containing protein [Thiotrichaceae bacterium]
MLFRTLLFACVVTSAAQAQISINNAPLLINTEQIYDISQDLGQTIGNNLFHTFDNFNLNQNQTAQFSGPNAIQNIISRVIGGEASFINGTIRSTIPNADFYFLNPYGIVFGEYARLDLQGSFHASTADYLKLSDGGEFHIRNPNQDILTVAPVAAFGFLNSTPAPISIQDSKLSVPIGETLSLISSDLQITGTDAFRNSKNRYPVTDNAALLQAKSGQINLITTAGNSLINLQNPDWHQTGKPITATNTVIDVTGETGGNIFIRAGDIQFTNTHIDSQTQGDKNGGIVDIQANNIAFSQGSELFLNTEGKGNATKLNIQARGDVTFSGENQTKRASTIDAKTKSKNLDSGNAPEITIQARNIAFLDGAHIYSESKGSGNGVNVTMQADDSVVLSGVDSSGWRIGGLTMDALGQGNAGHLIIEAKNITFENGAGLQSGAADGGDSASATIRATGTFTMRGLHKDETGSQLHTRVMGSSTGGQGGDLYIEANELIMQDGARIFASTDGQGDGGDITVLVKGTLSVSNQSQTGESASRIVSNSKGSKRVKKVGDAGKIIVQAGQLIMQDGANISSSAQAKENRFAGKAGEIQITVTDHMLLSGFNKNSDDDISASSGVYATSLGIGDNSNDAGKIIIQTGSLTIEDGAVIQTSTDNNANGGVIDIRAQDTIEIIGKNAETLELKQQISGIYARSDSVESASGSSGEIIIQADKLILTQHGTIATSSSGGGEAGNISITANALHMDQNSAITSASQLQNSYEFDTLADRDNNMLIHGDMIDIADNGDGKQARYVSIGQNFLQITAVEQVENLAELYELPKHYDLEKGNIIEVKDAGNGESARFVYDHNSSFDINNWTKIGNQVDVIVEDLDQLQEDDWYEPEEVIYPAGTIVQVLDVGNGTSTQVIYSNTFLPINGKFEVEAIRLNSFDLPDITTLEQLFESTYLEDGDTATLANNARFIFNDNQWLPLTGNVLAVSDFKAIDNLIKTQTGNISNIANLNGVATDFIYTGQNWLQLNPELPSVQTSSELKQLSAQEGDFIETQQTRQHFFYSGGQWTQQIKGGDAGQVLLNVDDIQLHDGEISTESVSSGGGRIVVNNHDLAFLSHAKITASVKEGIGDGGSLTVSQPNFIILDNSQVTAQAHEGQGGNIRVVASQFLSTPKNIVSASSQLGIDGNVEIDSPDETVSNALLSLNNSFTKQAQFKNTCKTVLAGQLPTEFKPLLSLKVNLYRFSNDFIGDWIPSYALSKQSSICK